MADSSEKAAAESQPIPALNGQAAVARSQVKVESVENYKKEKTLSKSQKGPVFGNVLYL